MFAHPSERLLREGTRFMVTCARAKIPTPILNSPDFNVVFGGADGVSLPLDEQGLIREVETVALPGTKFTILEPLENFIARVRTRDYKGEELFVDTRFLDSVDKNASERPLHPPSRETILERLISMLGSAYIWGGNWSAGIPEMLSLYPPKKKLNRETHTYWSLHGVDCSGLIYEATDGTTPRNTPELLHHGKALPVEGKTTAVMADLLHPLDLIVWKGHVIVALDNKTVIESIRGRGVIITEAKLRLDELMQERKPIDNSIFSTNKTFVIRRWYKHQ